MYLAKTIVQCERFLRFARRSAPRFGRNDSGGVHLYCCPRNGFVNVITPVRGTWQWGHPARPVILSEVPSVKRGTKSKDLAVITQ